MNKDNFKDLPLGTIIMIKKDNGYKDIVRITKKNTPNPFSDDETIYDYYGTEPYPVLIPEQLYFFYSDDVIEIIKYPENKKQMN